MGKGGSVWGKEEEEVGRGRGEMGEGRERGRVECGMERQGEGEKRRKHTHLPILVSWIKGKRLVDLPTIPFHRVIQTHRFLLDRLNGI